MPACTACFRKLWDSRESNPVSSFLLLRGRGIGSSSARQPQLCLFDCWRPRRQQPLQAISISWVLATLAQTLLPDLCNSIMSSQFKTDFAGLEFEL